MKTIRIFEIALLSFCCALMFTSCKGKKNDGTAQPVEQAQAQTVEKSTPLSAIEKYLIDEIAVNYGPGEVSIPCPIVMEIDESNPEDILAWGDFWVFNYDQAGDTLKTVSGGSHPGLMHIAKVGDDYSVKSFDEVGDGSQFMPTAKKIFGEKYDAFMKLNSDEKNRESVRKEFIINYVKKLSLPVKMYKDYGWDPISLD